MKTSRSASRIVWFEIAAFGIIIAISWASEWGFENIIFGEFYVRNWKDPMMQTCITLLVGLPTILLTRRLAKHLHELEGFLKICSWCNKVGQGDRWISIEDYLKTQLDTNTSHGICPACNEAFKQETARFRAKAD